jgi:hypothetical protein
LKNDVNVPPKSNKQKNCTKILFFAGVAGAAQEILQSLDELVRG